MTYIPPIIIILGTFGNIMSFIILSRKQMRKHSTYTYLAVLSITDLFVLCVGLLKIWVEEFTGYSIQAQHDWSCRTFVVLLYTASDYSVWLIIAVTVERWIAVCRPLKAPSLCNQRKAVKTIVAILIILMAINLHFLWTLGVKSYPYGDETFDKCDPGKGFELLVKEVWPWIDACIYSFLPLGIILTLNSLIIRQVVKSKRSRCDLSGNHALRSRKATKLNPDRNRNPQDSSFKLTVMLLSISFAFLITTLPRNSMLIANAFLGNPKDYGEVARRTMLQALTELLMYLNHSMNFYLYCATGEKFRHQLVCLFSGRKSQSPHPRTPRRDMHGEQSLPQHLTHSSQYICLKDERL